MRLRFALLSCVTLVGCTVQQSEPNRGTTKVHSGRASQSETADSPTALIGEPGTSRQPTIKLVNSTFEVDGLSENDLAALGQTKSAPADWAPIFSVRVITNASDNRKNQPPVLGSYTVDGVQLRFKPEFPVVPGVTYRASLDLSSIRRVADKPGPIGTQPNDSEPIEQDFAVPKPTTESTTVVTHVFPSTGTLPENQLKFYLHFSAPMSRGEAFRRLHLLDESGNELELPFLELDEELWDRQGRRFTLFLDPGRIKRGLRPREEFGPVFEQGKSYTLVIDREWQDADGNPLKQGIRKPIQIGPTDDKQPDPNTWKVQTPARGTTEPVLIRFPEPLDHAMLHRVIVVHDSADQLIDGQVKVDENETRWALVPSAPWQSGEYTIQVQTDLEDLAGNSIARVFDVDLLEPVSRSIKAERWSLPFRIGD